MPAYAPPRRIAWPLRRWPTVAGLAFAAFVSYGLVSGVELAPILSAAAMIYLGAAALGKRSAAWPLFFATGVVIGVGRVIDGRFEPTWALIGIAALLAVYGLVRGAIRPAEGLPLQSLAMLVYGGVAAMALYVDPTIGSYAVALGLLAHAGWDLYHFVKNRVVARSLAEFCVALDIALAVVIIAVTAG